MSLVCDRTFNATELGHFIIAILTSQIGILLAYLCSPLSLRNAHIGLIITLSSLSGS